jgi:hypothetical protein
VLFEPAVQFPDSKKVDVDVGRGNARQSRINPYKARFGAFSLEDDHETCLWVLASRSLGEEACSASSAGRRDRLDSC